MIVISDNTNPNYNGNITQANGLYRVEAGNLSAFSSTVQALSTSAYTIPVIFANAGNCKGIILPLIPTDSTVARSVTVVLQEFVGGTTWTDRATKTLTNLEISASYNFATNNIELYSTVNGFIKPFRFATPYAVTNAAGIWRFSITSAAGTGTWNLKMVTTGVPSYSTWCDNQVTFTSNQDQFIAMDTLYLNAAVTLAGALQASDTVNSIAGWICSNDTRDISTVSKLMWSPTPFSSYKVVCNGFIIMPEAGGFRAGTSGVPIPIASMGNIEWNAAAVGTNTSNVSSGFTGMRQYNHTGTNLFIYGEFPTYEDTELAAAAAAGQPTITVKDTTGWNIGDTVFIGEHVAKGALDTTVYTIQSISGTSITFTGNLTYARAYNATTNEGASVVRLNGYGFKMNSTNASGTGQRTIRFANIVVQGCQLENIYFSASEGIPNTTQRIGTDIEHGFYHCSALSLSNSFAALLVPTDGGGQGINPPKLGFRFNHVNHVKMGGFGTLFTGNGQGPFIVQNCIYLNIDVNGSGSNALGGYWTYVDNKHEGSNSSTFVRISGVKSTFRRNRFWGHNGGGSSGTGAVVMNASFFITDWGDNTFSNNFVGIQQSGYDFGCYSTGDSFGQSAANQNDVYQYYNTLVQMTYYNYKGTITSYILNTGIVSGSKTAFVSENQILNNDRILQQEGTITHTGYGLADTTVWTGTAFGAASAGQFGMRLAPYNATTNLLKYQDNNGSTTIGNCQNLPMQVSVRVKIANAAYYAGVHTKPTLKVTYDNGTVVTAVATGTTADQQLIVNFTPTTTVSAITVEVNGATDATGSNNQFYLGELVVSIPSGVLVDTTRLGSWANALPLGSSRTFPANSSIWDELTVNHTGAGSYGKEVNDIKSDTGLIGALL